MEMDSPESVRGIDRWANRVNGNRECNIRRKRLPPAGVSGKLVSCPVAFRRSLVVRTFTCVAVAVLAAGLVAAPVGKTDTSQFISLKGHTNVKWDENLHSNRFEHNNLSSLPTGKQKFGDVEFEIGDGLMQLGSKNVEGKPKEIKDIKVGRTFKKLHFLQACGYKPDEEGEATIGKYVIHYDDKSTADVEIVYGRDVVDWWAYPDQPAPTKGKAVWEGENEASKGFDAKIKLYLMTWENPKPDKKVVLIDFVATSPEQQAAAPFCVAITASDK
jgi:hypothetical protein